MNMNDDIDITIDKGQQLDIFGDITDVEIKRTCKLIAPTLFDYERESQALKELKGDKA